MSNRERIAELAKDTLILGRNTLLVNLRFLDCALSMLDFLLSEDGCIPGTPIPMNGGLIVTGKQIIYEPMWVLSRYRNEKEAIVRDYLHMVFHCIFHHPFVGGLTDAQRWDLACDIAVESVIDDLGISCVIAQRSRRQAALRGQIKQQIRLLSAEKIYCWRSFTRPRSHSSFCFVSSAEATSICGTVKLPMNRKTMSTCMRRSPFCFTGA